MFWLLFLFLLFVPLVELFIIIQLSNFIGWWATISMMVLTALVGSWLVFRSGFNVIRSIKSRLAEAELPTKELLDGVLTLLGGALMLTPGLLTDLLGLLFLIKPTQILLRIAVVKYFKKKIPSFQGFDMSVAKQYASTAKQYTHPEQRKEVQTGDKQETAKD